MSFFYPKMGPAPHEFKDAFEGWTIVEVGITDSKDVGHMKDLPLDGGLTFVLQKGDLKKRISLGYATSHGRTTEWVEFEGYL
jgi:hypothetical protein